MTENLDGCDLDLAADPIADADLAAYVLYADVDPNDPVAVEARRAEWAALAKRE